MTPKGFECDDCTFVGRHEQKLSFHVKTVHDGQSLILESIRNLVKDLETLKDYVYVRNRVREFKEKLCKSVRSHSRRRMGNL